MREKRENAKQKRIKFTLTFAILIVVLIALIYNLFIIGKSKQNTPDYNGSEPAITTKDTDPRTKPAKSEVIEKVNDYLNEGGTLELPVNGASGYASISLQLRKGPSTDTGVISTLKAGQGFTILAEENDWWQIEIDKEIGWVKHKYCLINLADVIPSIEYNITNSYASKIVSSGKSIANVTGQKLYDVYAYNKRINKEEYIAPVLYAMAQKICSAQQAALADGNTLIIYEAFRPYASQLKIVKNLSALVQKDSVVKKGVMDAQWSLGWFIATGISNHQRGYAIDVSLGKIKKQETNTSGSYIYKNITEITEYSMPTEIHELSKSSAVFEKPISSKSNVLWKKAKLSKNVNDEALLLQKYCTEAGLTPLASEWWHFNDLSCAELVEKARSDGKYSIRGNYSRVPKNRE